MKLNTIPEMQEMADQVRRDILRMVHAVQSGHPGGSLGCTEFMIALYFNHLRHDPKAWSMDGKEQDLFFLSNGHISPVFYSVLARSGYFPIEELASFRKINSRLQGHPGTKEGLPGRACRLWIAGPRHVGRHRRRPRQKAQWRQAHRLYPPR